MQFKPTETFELTADALYARNKLSERRSDQSNWFNRPFDVVTFDSGHSVATTTYPTKRSPAKPRTPGSSSNIARRRASFMISA